MIELFRITGSTSFAARATLEEIGAGYRVIDVHPGRREEAPGFAAANPLLRVPAIRDGETLVYETGAVLMYLAERFPRAGLAPQPGDATRGALYMLVGWESYADMPIGSDAVHAHYERVGARAAIARTRALDDLDERHQRFHPWLRGGKPL
jgi:glutathione S-transferase